MTIKCLTISRYSTSSPIYTIILDKSIPNISIDSDKIASKVKALRCKIDQRQLLKSEYGNWWVVHDRNDIIYALLTDPNYPQRHAYGLIQKLKQKTKQIPHAQYQTEDNIKLNIQKRADQLVNQYRDLTKIDKLAKANHQVNMLSGQIGTGIKKLIANQQTLTQMQSRAQRHNPTRMDSYNKTQPNSQGTLLANWYQQRIHRQKKGNGRAITRIHQPKNHQNLMQNTDGFKNNKRDDTKYRVIGDYNYNIGTSQNYQQIIYLFSYGKSSNKADSMNRIGKRQQMTQQMRKSNYQTTNKTTYVPKSFQNNKIGRLIMINQSGNQVPIQNFDFDLRQQNNFIQRGQITSDQQLRKIVDIDHGYQRAQPVTYWRQKMQDGNYYMSNPGKTQEQYNKMKGEQQKLFEDVFTVTDIDPNNKTPFRNVSRIHMASQYKVQMEIDIHSQLYPLTKGTRLFVKTTKGQHTRNVYNKEQIAKINQKDNFDYVMYGVVFQIQKSKDGDIIIYASFGGLIMKLKGNQAVLAGFRKEQTQARIYIMIRKA